MARIDPAHITSVKEACAYRIGKFIDIMIEENRRAFKEKYSTLSGKDAAAVFYRDAYDFCNGLNDEMEKLKYQKSKMIDEVLELENIDDAINIDRKLHGTLFKIGAAASVSNVPTVKQLVKIEDVSIPGMENYNYKQGAYPNVALNNTRPTLVYEDVLMTEEEIEDITGKIISSTQKAPTGYKPKGEIMTKISQHYHEVDKKTFDEWNQYYRQKYGYNAFETRKTEHTVKITYDHIPKNVNTIATWGCLVTALADVLSYLRNQNITPDMVDKQADGYNNAGEKISNGFYAEDSANLLFPNLLSDRYGYSIGSVNNPNGKNTTGLEVNASNIDFARQLIDEKIDSRQPVILQYGPRGNSHFVVAVGYKYDDYGNRSHYIINDPGAPNNAEDARFLDRQTLYNKYWGRKVTYIFWIE
jgi:hypothetical protein